MNLPSEISFVSVFQYSPSGTDELAQRSRLLLEIKRDSFFKVQSDDGSVKPVRAVKHSAAFIRTLVDEHPDARAILGEALGPDVVLVPVPGSAPLLSKSAHWSSMRICESLRSEGLAGEILPVLERVHPVQKSATAGRGQRPTPEQHYQSTRVRALAGLPIFSEQRVTLVDDFVTRGSTFLGVYRHIQEAFPG